MFISGFSDASISSPVKEWTQLLGTSSSDEGNSISTAADGSIYITGYTTGDLDGQTNSGSGWSKDAFISKLTFKVKPNTEQTPEQTPVPIEEDIIKQVESIGDITTQNKVSTFELKDPLQAGNQDIDIVIIGTKKKDKITGTSEREILAGQEGKNVLKGGGDLDGFLFNTYKGYGKKQADAIKDFDPDEGDSVLVEKMSLVLVNKLNLKL